MLSGSAVPSSLPVSILPTKVHGTSKASLSVLPSCSSPRSSRLLYASSSSKTTRGLSGRTARAAKKTSTLSKTTDPDSATFCEGYLICCRSSRLYSNKDVHFMCTWKEVPTGTEDRTDWDVGNCLKIKVQDTLTKCPSTKDNIK
jgi:hypothetical protein